MFLPFQPAGFSKVLKDCSQNMQGDAQSIMHTIDTLENKDHGYIPFLQVVHLCCGYALFAMMIHVPGKNSYGEHDETMAYLLLFPLLAGLSVSSLK